MDNHRFGPRKAILVLLALLAASQAFAEGAGGILSGTTRPAWNQSIGIPPALINTSIEYIGGFGYGVDHDGVITGGFGMGLTNYSSQEPEISGIVGGLITGQRLVGYSHIHLDLAARVGAGGLSYNNSRRYFILYAEPYVELGIGLTPWLHLSANAGYQFMGNLSRGLIFEELNSWSPNLGVTVSFGSFRR